MSVSKAHPEIMRSIILKALPSKGHASVEGNETEARKPARLQGNRDQQHPQKKLHKLLN